MKTKLLKLAVLLKVDGLLPGIFSSRNDLRRTIVGISIALRVCLIFTILSALVPRYLM